MISWDYSRFIDYRSLPLSIYEINKKIKLISIKIQKEINLNKNENRIKNEIEEIRRRMLSVDVVLIFSLEGLLSPFDVLNRSGLRSSSLSRA